MVVATRPIASGDELLQVPRPPPPGALAAALLNGLAGQDYRDIGRVDWLEALLEGAQLKSARQLGEALG